MLFFETISDKSVCDQLFNTLQKHHETVFLCHRLTLGDNTMQFSLSQGQELVGIIWVVVFALYPSITFLYRWTQKIIRWGCLDKTSERICAPDSYISLWCDPYVLVQLIEFCMRRETCFDGNMTELATIWLTLLRCLVKDWLLFTWSSLKLVK